MVESVPKALMKKRYLICLFGMNNHDVCLPIFLASQLCKKLKAGKLQVPEIKAERVFRLSPFKVALYEIDLEILLA